MATEERTMIDPNSPLSLTEKAVFGSNAKRHAAGFVIEVGSGALSEAAQLENHIRMIARTEGTSAANALLRQFGYPIPEEVAAAKAEAERKRVEREKAAYAALAEKEAAEVAAKVEGENVQEAAGPLLSKNLH
jgi:hypothetical protein